MEEKDKIERFDISLFYIGKSTDRIFLVLNNYSTGMFELDDSNNVMELYNVIQVLNHEYFDYFDAETKNKINEYKELDIKIKNDIVIHFSNLGADRFINEYSTLEFLYKEDYFDLFIKHGAYCKIDKKLLLSSILKANVPPNFYLKYKALVDYIDDELSLLFCEDRILSELLIDYCVEESSKKEIFIPKSLTKEKRKEVIDKYVDRNDVSHYYLQLIIFSMDKNKVNIGEEIKYKAKCKMDNIIDDINKEGNTFQFNIMIRSGDNINEHRILKKTGLELYYNTKQLRENLDYPSLFNNFIYKFDLFNFRTMNCNLVNIKGNNHIIDTFTEIKGERVYNVNHIFTMINNVFHIQLSFYLDFLRSNNIFIEDMFEWFFRIYIKDEFGIKDFIVNLPNKFDNIVDKCKKISIAFDEVSKQYDYYIKHGSIDRKFIEFSKSGIAYENIGSLLGEKYLYFSSKELTDEMSMLFSNQSTLYYIAKFKSKYNRLDELIIKEDVSIDDFYDYQINSIKWLIDRKTIIKDGNYLKLNTNKYMLLLQYYNENVINLHYNKIDYKKEFAQNEYQIKNTLLSVPESEYFNYSLNDKYSNGLAIRNKYIHGGSSLDEKVNKSDYYILIKFFIILIIKINDELCLKNSIN